MRCGAAAGTISGARNQNHRGTFRSAWSCPSRRGSEVVRLITARSGSRRLWPRGACGSGSKWTRVPAPAAIGPSVRGGRVSSITRIRSSNGCEEQIGQFWHCIEHPRTGHHRLENELPDAATGLEFSRSAGLGWCGAGEYPMRQTRGAFLEMKEPSMRRHACMPRLKNREGWNDAAWESSPTCTGICVALEIGTRKSLMHRRNRPT